MRCLIRMTLGLLAVVAVDPILPSPPAIEESQGLPGRSERPRWRLSYRIPPGWVADRGAAERMTLTALLVPDGAVPADAEAVITVAFRLKNDHPLTPRTLERYFSAEMRQLLLVFPDLDSRKWIPGSLIDAPGKIASLEIDRVLPGPMRIVMIDAGDAFYSIKLTVRDRALLERADVQAFFDSLLLLPLRS